MRTLLVFCIFVTVSLSSSIAAPYSFDPQRTEHLSRGTLVFGPWWWADLRYVRRGRAWAIGPRPAATFVQTLLSAPGGPRLRKARQNSRNEERWPLERPLHSAGMGTGLAGRRVGSAGGLKSVPGAWRQRSGGGPSFAEQQTSGSALRHGAAAAAESTARVTGASPPGSSRRSTEQVSPAALAPAPLRIKADPEPITWARFQVALHDHDQVTEMQEQLRAVAGATFADGVLASDPFSTLYDALRFQFRDMGMVSYRRITMKVEPNIWTLNSVTEQANWPESDWFFMPSGQGIFDDEILFVLSVTVQALNGTIEDHLMVISRDLSIPPALIPVPASAVLFGAAVLFGYGPLRRRVADNDQGRTS